MIVKVTPRPDYDALFELFVEHILENNPGMSPGVARLKAAQEFARRITGPQMRL